jgi:hypothetical protein
MVPERAEPANYSDEGQLAKGAVGVCTEVASWASGFGRYLERKKDFWSVSQVGLAVEG